MTRFSPTTEARVTSAKAPTKGTLPMKRQQRPYNILHTVRSLRVDGVVMVILRNLSGGDTPGFRHFVCSMFPDGEMTDEYIARGIEPLTVHHRGALSTPVSVARLVKLIREMEIDLVHANRTIDLGIAGTAAKVCGIPVVSSLHWLGRTEDHPEDDAGGWWPTAKKGAAVLLNRLLADRVIAVSGAVRDSFGMLRGFPTSRTEVVYPGLNMDTAAPDPTVCARLRKELDLDTAYPVLLNVGRLVSVKGQKYLIPMMRQVRERWPHAKLLIAGEGDLRQPLEQQIQEHGLSGAVTLLGTRSDVNDLLAVSDLLVLASESEAAPLPPMEAMRAGKPVVATDVGGVSEIVVEGATGYIVPRANPDAMTAAVLRVFEVPDRAKGMGEAGRKIALERFEVSKSLRATERIYRALLKPTG